METDEQEFRLEILTTSIAGGNRINICLKCVSPICEHITEILEREFNFYEEYEINEKVCLIQIGLEIYDEIQKDTAVYGVKYKAYLSDFYNNVTKYGKGLSYLSKKLKGGAAALLCMLINNGFSSGFLREDDIIILDASGELAGEDMHRLLDYYISLGFQESYPDMINIYMDHLTVPMYGKVKDILNKCSQKQFSQELRQVLEQL